MDHFMEEVVVKHNRGVENALYILSNIVMVFQALWALCHSDAVYAVSISWPD